MMPESFPVSLMLAYLSPCFFAGLGLLFISAIHPPSSVNPALVQSRRFRRLRLAITVSLMTVVCPLLGYGLHPVLDALAAIRDQWGEFGFGVNLAFFGSFVSVLAAVPMTWHILSTCPRFVTPEEVACSRTVWANNARRTLASKA